jgi:hypothetical protein
MARTHLYVHRNTSRGSLIAAVSYRGDLTCHDLSPCQAAHAKAHDSEQLRTLTIYQSPLVHFHRLVLARAPEVLAGGWRHGLAVSGAGIAGSCGCGYEQSRGLAGCMVPCTTSSPGECIYLCGICSMCRCKTKMNVNAFVSDRWLWLWAVTVIAGKRHVTPRG